MHCTVMSCTLQRYTVTGLLTALAIFRLAAGSARAQQPDATNISVAVAQANAHCLIKTGAMKPEKPSPSPMGSCPNRRSVSRPATRSRTAMISTI